MSNTNRRPRMLELFAGEGGATAGYQRAGWDVFAVDLNAKVLERNPADGMHVGDALVVLTALIAGLRIPFTRPDDSTVWLGLDDFDAIHASPPCQGYSTITPDQSKHPRLIDPVRELLVATGKSYVIENVAGARKHLREPVLLCGDMFGLTVRRHRYFETSTAIAAPKHTHTNAEVVGVYGDHPDSREYLRPNGTRRGRKAQSNEEASSALGGVGWMTWDGMTESIPPVYAQHVGAQLLASLTTQEVAA
jgi:DNA (cytosine-5)-methyltransferase 1